MTKEKEAKRQARKAAEVAKCADHRDDIGALLDLIGQQVKTETGVYDLADLRMRLIELAARPMFHLHNNSETETHAAIEDNLALLRECPRYQVGIGNGKTTTVSIPKRED